VGGLRWSTSRQSGALERALAGSTFDFQRGVDHSSVRGMVAQPAAADRPVTNEYLFRAAQPAVFDRRAKRLGAGDLTSSSGPTSWSTSLTTAAAGRVPFESSVAMLKEELREHSSARLRFPALLIPPPGPPPSDLLHYLLSRGCAKDPAQARRPLRRPFEWPSDDIAATSPLPS